MIKYFAVKNFRSIRDENILNFDAGTKGTAFKSNPVLGFAGANASGKTTILQAITFTLWFMQHSFLSIDENEGIPIETFCLQEDEPLAFHIIIAIPTIVDNQEKYVDYEYQLIVNKNRVISEALYYFPYKRERIAYLRNNGSVKFGDSIPIPTKNRSAFEKDLRENCSVISYAAQYSSQTVAKRCKHYQVLSNVNVAGLADIELTPSDFEQLLNDEHKRNKMVTFLKLADTGIEDVFMESVDGISVKAALTAASQSQKDRLPPAIMLNLDRISDNLKFSMRQFGFRHRIDEVLFNFPLEQESAGTRKYIALLNIIIEALDNGATVILDEIELKLHQNLVAYLLGLFGNQYENKHNAQLLFSFHNSHFMRFLKPEQLWFTEKNDEGATELFSAAHFADVRHIHERDLEELYRIGRFGAVPRGL